MFMKIGLMPIIAAASVALAGCHHQSSEAPANNAAPAQANSAGQSSYSQGGSPSGGTCGGIVGTQCSAATDFCKRPTGQCNVADGQGTCTPRPQRCTRDYRPVCGCDHRTYGNSCEADAAGVSVQAQGRCPGTAAAETNSAAAQ